MQRRGSAARPPQPRAPGTSLAHLPLVVTIPTALVVGGLAIACYALDDLWRATRICAQRGRDASRPLLEQLHTGFAPLSGG